MFGLRDSASKLATPYANGAITADVVAASADDAAVVVVIAPLYTR